MKSSVFLIQSTLITFLFLTIASVVHGKGPKKIKYGAIPKADLEMTVYKPDPEADAVILEDIGNNTVKTDFTGKTTTVFTCHRRIKILKEAGLKWADVRIYHWDNEKVWIKAHVIQPDGQTTVLDNNEIFEVETGKHRRVKSFALPNVQIGSVIEFFYQTDSENYVQPHTWYFQSSIPTRYSEMSLQINTNLNYIWIQQPGFIKVNQEKNLLYASDVPAIKGEKYITTLSDYKAKVRFQLDSKYGLGGVKLFPKWEDLAIYLRNHKDFGSRIHRKGGSNVIWASIKEDVASLPTQLAKAQFIYRFVQEKMNANQYADFFARKSFNQYFHEGTATSAQINLMFLALLKRAKIKSNAVLTSERSHGKMITQYPLVDQFNTIFVLADIDNQNIVLDASQKYLPFGYPREEALNGMGWVVDSNNPKWIKISPPKATSSYFFDLELSAKGGFSGKFTAHQTGYNAVDTKVRSKEEDQNYLISLLENSSLEFSTADVQIDNQTDHSNPLKIIANISSKEKSIMELDIISLSPVLLTFFKESSLTKEKRVFPVDIPYPFEEKSVIKISIPPGYFVEEIPISMLFELPNSAGNFTFSPLKEENIITISTTIHLKKLEFLPNEYHLIKSFFDTIEEKLEEKIILRKDPDFNGTD